MELAQLWQCPVPWCTVWKGTAQDCVDHMRRAHDIPPVVKAANLARWFTPWTVTREQWILCCLAALGYRYFTAIGSSVVRELMRWWHVFLVTSARPGACGTDVADITSGLSRQDGRCFASTGQSPGLGDLAGRWGGGFLPGPRDRLAFIVRKRPLCKL